MLVTRPPCPLLRPHVRQLWAATGETGAPTREHVLPTGGLHLAFRIGGRPVRVFSGPDDTAGSRLGHAVLGGARSEFHVREAGGCGASVGALLAPGGAQALFAAPADEFTGRHTPLADLWGTRAADALVRLHEARDAGARLDALERLLLERLDPSAVLHPVAACALDQLRAGATVDAAVAATGFSHRHVLTLFRHATGLAPKQFARVLRMQSVLARAMLPQGPGWADLALEAGFSDQPHFNREFAAFAGMTPQAWRRAGARHPNHVPASPLRVQIPSRRP